MTIILNGKPVPETDGITLKDFLKKHVPREQNCVIEYNNDIFGPENDSGTLLKDGDTINLFCLVAGG